MGRRSGYIALYSGLAGGADSIIVPEVPHNLDQVCEKNSKGLSAGKKP